MGRNGGDYARAARDCQTQFAVEISNGPSSEFACQLQAHSGQLTVVNPQQIIPKVNLSAQCFREHRRSTRVPLDVSIEVEGNESVMKGVTVVVNLHGALIRTVGTIRAGSRIRVTVYLTGKSAMARVVYVSPENPLACGIELEKPQNIWGVSLVPDDWDEAMQAASY